MSDREAELPSRDTFAGLSNILLPGQDKPVPSRSPCRLHPALWFPSDTKLICQKGRANGRRSIDPRRQILKISTRDHSAWCEFRQLMDQCVDVGVNLNALAVGVNRCNRAVKIRRVKDSLQ